MKNKNLRQIIKKTIVENLNKKSCDCGCGGCSDTVKKPQLSLNENQINKTLISEGLNWHLTHQKPLTEQLYRAGSEKYFSLWKEARHLYSRGLFESTFEEDIEILTETNLGEFGILEDGTRVPLDFPMEEENLTESTNYFIPKVTNEQGANTFWEDDDDRITLQDILELTKDIKVINFPTKKLANIVLNWDNNPEEIERISQVKVSSQYPILIMADEEGKIQWILDGNHRAQKALRSKSETIPAKIITPSDLNSKAKKIFGLCEIENKIFNLTESTNYFIPKVTKDKKHPNFLYINIPYPTGKGFLYALGTQTAAGQERQQGAKKALSIGQKIYDKIENHPDIEDIDLTDLENGIVQIFIVSDILTPEKLSDLTESKTPTEKEIIDDILNELNNLQEININNIKEKLKLYAKKGLLTLSIILSVTNSLQANNPQLAQDVLKTSIEMVNSGEKVNFYSAVIGLTQNILSNAIEKGDIEFAGYLKEVKLHYENLRDGGKGNNLSQGAKTAEKNILKFLFKAGKEKTISFIEAGKNIKTKLNESKNENKPLNKPVRDSSGGKAYKVYVRDPKTKNIKTVRFGSGGLRAKINNPKARKAFAARHKCGQGEEKTSPKWWSCRIGRYWKQLGGDKNFSGFW